MPEFTVDVEPFAFVIALVLGASYGYGKVFGPHQTVITQYFIDAFGVRKRFKGVMNLGIGTALATMLAALAAFQADNWLLLGFGIIGGIKASVEASRAHDAEDE